MGKSLLLVTFIENRLQQLVKRIRLDPSDGLDFVYQSFIHQIYRYLDGRRARAFSDSCLQHPQLAVLNRKFHVLHVAVMCFHEFGNVNYLPVDIWRCIFQLGDGSWCPDPCNHVFSLGVHQKLPVQGLFTGCRVSRKQYTSSTIFAHVPKYHCLDVYRSTPVTRNTIHGAIGDGPLVVPRTKNCAYSSP